LSYCLLYAEKNNPVFENIVLRLEKELSDVEEVMDTTQESLSDKISKLGESLNSMMEKETVTLQMNCTTSSSHR
jgi:hypothetical protein